MGGVFSEKGLAGPRFMLAPGTLPFGDTLGGFEGMVLALGEKGFLSLPIAGEFPLAQAGGPAATIRIPRENPAWVQFGFDGSLRLDVVNTDGVTPIKDVMNLTLAAGFNAGEVYTVDRSNPSVTSIIRAGSNPTNATSVDFTVTFSEPVTGVDNSDFSLTTSGVAGALVSGVTGSGSTRTVTVNTGSGNGTIKLNLIDDDTVVDLTNKPLGGPGAGNGNFTTGEVYDIDKTAPIATIDQAVAQSDPVTGPTATTVINFKVTLNKSLTTASAIASFTNSDISLSGTAGATVANITGSGATYNVAVEGMTQSGTVIININPGVFQDDAGNPNSASTIVDNSVTFNVDNFTTFEVNSTADTNDGQCAPIGTGNGCTLREAINAANTDAGAETITFNSTVFASSGTAIALLSTAGAGPMNTGRALGTPTSFCQSRATRPAALRMISRMKNSTTPSETMPTRSLRRRRQAACHTPSERAAFACVVAP